MQPRNAANRPNNKEGFPESVLVADRLQHGTRHLSEAGLLRRWSGRLSPAIIRAILAPILEGPTETWQHRLGRDLVTGFGGVIGGTRVAVFVFVEGPHRGTLASSFVPSDDQWACWGCR
jgi:hypothetical protein